MWLDIIEKKIFSELSMLLPLMGALLIVVDVVVVEVVVVDVVSAD